MYYASVGNASGHNLDKENNFIIFMPAVTLKA
jgi:hypothetical protein